MPFRGVGRSERATRSRTGRGIQRNSQRRRKKKSRRSFGAKKQWTLAERKAFAALVAPVTKRASLRGVATFKLVASRGEHGPLVESRIPLRDFERVTALLHQRR